MKKTIYTFIFFLIVFAAANTLKIEDCTCQTGWFSQPLPVSGQMQDLKFIDANTGFVSMNPAITLRTTNGGYNWNYILTSQYVGNFEIIDSNIIYANGMSSNAYGILLRSYNRGATWDSLPVANSWTINGLSFVNRDTGWVGGSSGGLPYLWRTTNAGLNWTVQSDNTGFGKVFFLKTKVNGEYVGWSMNSSEMWKTTNSGNNWTQIQSNLSASKILFINEITGYIASGTNMKKTTNGGLNWINQPMPSDSTIMTRILADFVIKDEIIYGTGGIRYFGGIPIYSIIWKSTNGGNTWGYQQPDTSIDRFFVGIDFVNKDTGWSSNIHTTNGGGPIIFPTYIDSNSAEIPKDYVLKQNYPNPFNPSTTIEFSIPKDSYTTIKIIDMTGRTVFIVAYELLLNSGIHKFKIEWFEKLKLSSGIYFYRMEARGKNNGKTIFTQTRKMVYIK